MLISAAQQHVSQLQERDVPESGENRGPEINFALWMLTCISALFLSLRLYCKSYRHKDLWWDDWILILSWVSVTESQVYFRAAANVKITDPPAGKLHYNDS